jgi:hypothetical protein
MNKRIVVPINGWRTNAFLSDRQQHGKSGVPQFTADVVLRQTGAKLRRGSINNKYHHENMNKHFNSF